MMKTANSLLMDLEEQMNMIGTPFNGAQSWMNSTGHQIFLPWIGWRWYHHF